ncbi:MAG: YihY/virulence factor BrkB family protein [Candidatus Contendobacter sp.]|nr:MAG: YihY/virulence factor BrkB family protein [Candidatus Contendobacter sp.]
MSDVQRWTARWRRWAFEEDRAERPRLERLLVVLTRLLYSIVLKFADGQLNRQASSLAYTTLLSLVPLLAVIFSVLKGFGVQNQLEPLLMGYLEPMGQAGLEAGQRILDFVNNLRVGVLGSLGIALLFYTVLSLFQKIEEAFNEIWRVPRARGLGRRFSEYLSVLLVGPVLLFAGLSVTASALNHAWVQRLVAIEPFGVLILGLGRVMPYLLICMAFTFMYVFLTNTRVRLRAALAGGVFAGVLWYATGLIFAKFVANSSSYSAIYSGFAAAVLFVIWVNVGWLIVLVGAQVACYWQNPHRLRPRGAGGGLRDSERSVLALTIMTLIGRAHYRRDPLWTLNRLAARCEGSSPEVVTEVVEALRRKELIVASSDDPPVYLPAHDIGGIGLEDIVAAVREEGGASCPPAVVREVMGRINAAIGQTLKGQSLKDLVVAEENEGR